MLTATLVFVCALAHAQTKWVGSWATSQQLVEPHNSIPADDLKDVTLRQIVHLTIGGPELRVRLSNRYGSVPLHFTSVHIAHPIAPDASKIDPASDRQLTFSGHSDVTVPEGADYLSDPVAYATKPLSDLAITVYIDQLPQDQTGHPGSRATSYLVHGNQVTAPELVEAKKIEHWYFIAGIDLITSTKALSVVVVGDSITDGHGATTNGNDRWPDILAKRLQASSATQSIAVLNHGIGGNRLLVNGLGPNALARFDHDVLAQPGVSYLLVLEGINDIGMLSRTAEVSQAEHDLHAKQIIGAYEQMIARAHAHGIKVIGCTILPFVGSGFYHPGPITEAERQAVNAWIRSPGHFDEVVDFDRVTRDPEHPDRLLPVFDSGDHLHPSPAGYAAMANAVPLSLFQSTKPASRVAPVRKKESVIEKPSGVKASSLASSGSSR
jgi:lysophospholipase L1-like esterase